MRKLGFLAFCLLLFGSVVIGQTIDTKWHCSKAAENPTLKVGDVPDHSYGLAQGTCEATAGGAGEKSGAWTEYQEMWKASFTTHGRFNVTMDNGDMVYYTYEVSGTPDSNKLSNKWKIVRGSGKHKGIKGSGTCSGTRNDDGSSDWECMGTLSMAASAKAMK